MYNIDKTSEMLSILGSIKVFISKYNSSEKRPIVQGEKFLLFSWLLLLSTGLGLELGLNYSKYNSGTMWRLDVN
jgi:hypothetical protein